MVKAMTGKIDLLVKWCGESTSLLSFVLIILICVDVTLRYLFSTTEVWVLDLEWHLFALIFLIGASYTMQVDKHVRVDVFYDRYSPKVKSIVDLVGHLLFLLPWSVVVIYTSYNYAINSWYIREGAADPGGLPMRYVIKFAILVGFVLLLLQALSQILKSIAQLRSGETWK